jgi:hypothetical protein
MWVQEKCLEHDSDVKVAQPRKDESKGKGDLEI